MRLRIWNNGIVTLAVFALASGAFAGVSAKGINPSSKEISKDPEVLLSDEEISRRNREVLKTLLENANRNFERHVDRKPAVLAPPIYENGEKVSEQDLISDDLSVQPAELLEIE